MKDDIPGDSHHDYRTTAARLERRKPGFVDINEWFEANEKHRTKQRLVHLPGSPQEYPQRSSGFADSTPTRPST